MVYWHQAYKPNAEKMLEANRDVSQFDIFATFHKVKINQTLYKKKITIPELFAYSNSYWLAAFYMSGEITAWKLTPTKRKKLLEGKYHVKLVKLQMEGKEFLKKWHHVLCGPDRYYTDIIYSLGQDFYFGTFLPEMQLCIKKGMDIWQILKHNFQACPYMMEMRKQESKRWKDIVQLNKKRKRRLKLR